MVAFWRKTAKTMGHVDTSFKGYQPYEFTYIRDLAEPIQKLTGPSDGTKKKKKAFHPPEDQHADRDVSKPSEDKDE